MTTLERNRPLAASEMSLARWMLEHGEPKARDFLEQLAEAEVTPWRCPCGCGSINFQIKGRDPAPPGVHVLGDFIFGPHDEAAAKAHPRETLINEPVVRITDEAGCNFQIDVGI
ncbi:hypothetical protein [Burkholderia vietnamiensis]|uniref:hypothetical protein n=1 Tax=Burkholderia vietnamiensis TaxID=60552 RepID=UPI002659A02B|nr:hypothetical protein [Burkholderia vietnamiensis]